LGSVTIKYTAADLMWRLGKYIVGGMPEVLDVSFNNTDSGVIAHSLLAGNTYKAGQVIIAGIRETFIPRTVSYHGQKVLDAIMELGAIAGSYEWALRYSEASPTASPSCFLDLETQLGGNLAGSVFFEYGLGLNNCSGYTRSRSVETLVNEMIVEGPRTTGVNAVVLSTDSASQTAYGTYWDYLSFGTATSIVDEAGGPVPDLLQALADAHVTARKLPREIVQLTPFPLLSPRYMNDWHVGDIVTARVAVEGLLRVNGQARIWGADISIDELGNETPTILLVPD
jgi:hypothetical protein